MKLFDLHTDTALHAFYYAKRLDSTELSSPSRTPSAWEARSQVFAVFTPNHLSNEAAYYAFFAAREHLLDELDARKPALTPYLSVEDARLLNGRLERVDELCRAGVSLITPLWRGETVIGGAFDTTAGLTEFGAAAISRMQDLNILVDTSHASLKAFWDIADISAKGGHPLIATHSNAFSVHPHPRNLNDAQFEAIRACGGLVGLSLCPEHLTADRATVCDVLRHLDHYLSRGGEDTVALGTDFDGISATPCGLATTDDLLTLAEAMLKEGYNEQIVHNLFYKNAEAFFGKHKIKILKRQEKV